MTTSLFLGLDVGTSGVRGIAIDESGVARAQASRPMPAPTREPDGGIVQDPAVWREALLAVLGEMAGSLGERIRGIAIDGTSGTLLLADAEGRPMGPGRMYNDGSAAHLASRIKAAAPPESGAHGATSPLARLLVMQEGQPGARYALHQADWLAGLLTGRLGLSDDNNALKLGWDPVSRRWPAWIKDVGARTELLPEVRIPGEALGAGGTRISPSRLGLREDCLIVAGTTDGCASFLATGAEAVGDGVSALGSTLTIKLLADRPLFAPEFGVYSHRMGDTWLAGGASNTGGAALLRFLTAERMAELTPLLQPDTPTGRHWHPLPGKGERFPVADPAMTFEPTDRPEDEPGFFQALLEGIGEVEARAYGVLAELGGPRLKSVRTVGGGAANAAWTAIRARLLGVPMPEPLSLEAAYGTALLARKGVTGG